MFAAVLPLFTVLLAVDVVQGMFEGGGLAFWFFAVVSATAALVAAAFIANRLRLNRWLSAKPLLMRVI